MIWVTKIINWFTGGVGKIVGIVLAVLSLFVVVRQSGKDAERAKLTKESLEGVKTRNEIETDINRLNDAERKRLRSKWTRPN